MKYALSFTAAAVTFVLFSGSTSTFCRIATGVGLAVSCVCCVRAVRTL